MNKKKIKKLLQRLVNTAAVMVWFFALLIVMSEVGVVKAMNDNYGTSLPELVISEKVSEYIEDSSSKIVSANEVIKKDKKAPAKKAAAKKTSKKTSKQAPVEKKNVLDKVVDDIVEDVLETPKKQTAKKPKQEAAKESKVEKVKPKESKPVVKEEPKAESVDYKVSDSRGLEQEVFAEINRVRAEHGLHAYNWDTTTHEASMIRAYENYYLFGDDGIEHYRPGGVDVFTLAPHAGSEILLEGWHFSAYDYVQGWLNSPSHRKVILSPDYTYLSVGIFHSGSSYKAASFAR